MNTSDSTHNYFLIGRITRTHGVKGNLVVILDVDDPNRYKKTKTVHVLMNGLFVSHDVASFTINGKNAIIHIKGIDTVEDASAFLKSELYLPLDELPKLKGNRLYFHEAIGMMVTDEIEGKLGPIVKIMDLPEQPVAVVDFQGKELLFPFLTLFFKNIDRKNKELLVRLPEGLVEIYRTS
ncbi:MAG: ribosome maturation factor RimM [Bacteroidota bacterium]